MFTDDGVSYDLQIRTAKIDHGTSNWKFIPRIRLVADTQSAGTATLEASDDDFATWDTLGTFDLTVAEKEIHSCGSYEGGRAYRLTHSYAGPFRAESLEIDYEIQ